MPASAIDALIGNDQLLSDAAGFLGLAVSEVSILIGLLRSAPVLELFLAPVPHCTVSAWLSTRPTVVFEIWCSFAIWPRLLPRSRSRTIAARSMSSGRRPM